MIPEWVPSKAPLIGLNEGKNIIVAEAVNINCTTSQPVVGAFTILVAQSISDWPSSAAGNFFSTLEKTLEDSYESTPP